MFLIINAKLDRIAKKDGVMTTSKSGGGTGYSSNKNDYSDDDN